MSKRKIQATSREAFDSLKAEELRVVYIKIKNALERLGTASTEQIADFLTMEHAKIHKRVSEMERMCIIYRPGHRVPTKSGRTAFVWALCGAGAKTDNENKIIPGKSVQDYAKIIQQIQNNLF